mmetsp:Transcript_3163/g.7408  ORF Transcript_3163/g.7408 Transcript_3163/m.7408 type:complete len:460 (+) Transcript_3163:81-1460(+)|eukprot:CAMPEP_0170601358 /NCGR_PEP_ID=MMETSP0224-20130122/17816_1 /TAXON_ID=285029 /ORGANISM="Togula jolla, Strain CCCM 725" /LENGTH=459 /DNA_ID=CAMNT_0010926127 /DNA_START=70 /DNA_END=1449 /DNA_ORIENTATION=+
MSYSRILGSLILVALVPTPTSFLIQGDKPHKGTQGGALRLVNESQQESVAAQDLFVEHMGQLLSASGRVWGPVKRRAEGSQSTWAKLKLWFEEHFRKAGPPKRQRYDGDNDSQGERTKEEAAIRAAQKEALSVPSTWQVWGMGNAVLLACCILNGLFVGSEANNAAILTLWVTIGMLFNFAVIGSLYGEYASAAWLTGYVYECIFAIDNLFIFNFLFSSYGLPASLNRKALCACLCGQIVLRGFFYVGLAAAIRSLPIVHYIAGFLLVVCSLSALKEGHGEESDEETWLVSSVKRIAGDRLVDNFGDIEKGGNFFVKHEDRRCVTLLFLVVTCMILVDAFFGVDCTITKAELIPSHFLNFTSSAFALFTINAAYFIIDSMANSLAYVKTGICVVLVFVGLELLAMDFVELGAYASLGVMLSILGVSVVLSLQAAESDGKGHGKHHESNEAAVEKVASKA